MRRFATMMFLGLVVAAWSSPAAWSQARAQISGAVKDQSGAVLPGVEVTVTQTETGVSRNVITNEAGAFELPNLALGPYRLEAALTGFRTYVENGIVLQVNSNPVINAVLQVGQVAETVEVQANAALVETRATGIGQVVENQRIVELPLNGRNPTDLIQLAGAAVPVERAPSSGMPGGQSISVAGGLQFGVGYFLDGALHTDMYDVMNLAFSFPRAPGIQSRDQRPERAKRHPSERGRQCGDRSGTNAYHGDFLNLYATTSSMPEMHLRRRRHSLKRNQYGGTIGGPNQKNKLFFFAGYQGTRTRSSRTKAWALSPRRNACRGLYCLRVAGMQNQSANQPHLSIPLQLDSRCSARSCCIQDRQCASQNGGPVLRTTFGIRSYQR